MDTPRVTIDDATAKALTGNGADVPLYDAAGNLVGYYVSPRRMAKIEDEPRALYDALDAQFPPDEIRGIEERRKHDPRPNIPHDEVIRRVEAM